VTATKTPSGDEQTDGPKKSLAYRLYHGETSIDFMGQRRRWFIVSGVIIVVGLASLFVRGLNLGIDFKGGTAWEVKSSSLSVTRVRDALRPMGLADAKIEVLTGGEGRLIRVQADVKGESAAATKLKTDVRNELAKLGNTDPTQVAFTDVGPSWGKQISNKAIRALVFFFLAITAYISFRFEWKMAVAAIAAVVHDILVTVGIYSLSGFQVTPGTVIAFLTILGYSLYDTIVVFDRVEENARGIGATGRLTYTDTVNLSMNQVLMRSLNTSLVAILPVLSVLILGAYILGAIALEDFGLALSIGLLTGAYSSIFIASPLLGILKEREPRYAAVRQRLANRAAMTGPLTPAAAAIAGASGGGVGGGGGGAGGGVSRGGAKRNAARDVDDDDDGGPPLRPAASGDAASAPSKPGSGQPTAKRPGGRPSGNRPAPRPRKKGKRR
jgi:preprotein translocase subunit SecF